MELRDLIGEATAYDKYNIPQISDIINYHEIQKTY